MLNTSPRLPGEARLKYLDATFKVLETGDFVVCAITGKKIPLPELRYWSIDKQEAYYDAVAANQGMLTGEAES
ncbi:MAG: hypothetical protein CMK07_10390 [Ponticaulis sp.]|nr:hypothetical protein [Ponticaulis sp.]